LYRILVLILMTLYLVAPPAFASDSNVAKLENRINNLRANHDLRPYKSNAELQRVAQRRSDRLAEIQKLKHSPNLKKRLRARAVGEIIGVGTGWKGVYRSLKRSPEHKGLILSKTFRQQGAGQTRDRRGRLWVVVIFQDPR